jgi:hypothetical protein
MSLKLITPYFKTHSAAQFLESFSEPQNTVYFVGGHRSQPFTSDVSPPDPFTDVYSTHYKMYDELVFGKHVTSSDIVHMARNTPWVAGTVYDMYDDQTADLYLKNFYVVSQEAGSYHIFKCLNNNGGVVSTSQPLFSEISPEDEFYKKDDGYEWKYMYSITASQYMKFATTDYVPLFVNADVTANSISGSIDTVIISNAGAQYKSYAIGTIKESAVSGNNLVFSLESSTMTLSSNTSFYTNCSIFIDEGSGNGEIRTIVDYYTSGGERRVLIDRAFDTLPARDSVFKIAPRVIISGDGQNALARSEVANGSISEVVIISRGSNYTFADITVIGNTGITLASTTTSAIVRPIISPPGGHGSNIINELYAYRVGISVDFAGSENSTIPTANDFRKITLIKDPLFERGILNLSSISEVFTAGEKVIQLSTNASATVYNRSSNNITLTNISGVFDTSNTSIANTALTGITSSQSAFINSVDRSFETFDQRKIYTVSVLDGTFVQDEQVVQAGLNTIQTEIVKLTLGGSAYSFIDGETVTQATTGAIGTVIARFVDILTLTNTSGNFAVGYTVTGSTSATPINVTKFDTTFDATASGYVHEITPVSGSTKIVSLTDVVGSFLLSDTLTNTINTFKGQTSNAIASLTGLDISKNRLVDGSGQIMYIENIVPIVRNADQTERVKLIIEF